MKGAAKRTAAARSHERFRIQVTSNFFERRTCSRCRGNSRPQLSFFFFAKKFFRAGSLEKLRDQRSRLQLGSNEVETGKYSGSWLPRINRHASSLPPSPFFSGGSRCRLLLRMQ